MSSANWRTDLNVLYEKKGTRLIFKIVLFPVFILLKLWRRIFRSGCLEMDHLEIVVGSLCTLHCKKCANLMQYYEHPTVFDAGRMEEDVRKLLELDIEIDRANIVGGEPFLYKRLPDLIALLQNSPKIGCIRVITNGTVPPQEPLLAALKAPKVHVFISNYVGIGARTNEVYSLLKNAGVDVYVSTVAWLDYHHNFAGYHRSAEAMEKVYRNCRGACHELVDGEIHLCPTSAHGMRLGLIPRDENSFVSIRHDGSKKAKKEILRKLDFLLTHQIPNACDYCCADSGEIIPVAEQLPPGTFLGADGSERRKNVKA